MQIQNYILVTMALFLIATCKASAEATFREIEFNVYGQYPVRNVTYLPINEAALKSGEEVPEPIEIKTHSLARTGPYSYKGDSHLQFYDSTNKNLVAQLTIPPETGRWLLIFVRNPRYKSQSEQQLKYLVYPFDDSLSHLPSNGLIFLNISGKELDGLLEDKRVNLDAGESEIYRVQESLPINLWARSFDGKKLLPALIKTYKFAPNHRYLIIFFPPVLTGSADLDVRFLSESVK
ncbi:hypothetical protein QEH59_08020 [Coraliomargarita sp. SDUM461004]|uniref:DUF3108 domain-containing protein n=1 Tax=Thalassobacterium sedimentorum TaxID=3041258 RepID=A0ABU1AHW7_9BACT|nr:hypothetical protein [Coraliomargarita sp. SDUM461004]MDQ8194368.1 hypothetical protein [Coraliomargarita sp. SDUM461004]